MSRALDVSGPKGWVSRRVTALGRGRVADRAGIGSSGTCYGRGATCGGGSGHRRSTPHWPTRWRASVWSGWGTRAGPAERRGGHEPSVSSRPQGISWAGRFGGRPRGEARAGPGRRQHRRVVSRSALPTARRDVARRRPDSLGGLTIRRPSSVSSTVGAERRSHCTSARTDRSDHSSPTCRPPAASHRDRAHDGDRRRPVISRWIRYP